MTDLWQKEKSLAIKVFDYLDDKELSQCKNVHSSWYSFINAEKFYWKRVFQNCDKWKMIFQKCNSQTIEKLGSAFLEEHFKWNPLTENPDLKTKLEQEERSNFKIRENPIFCAILTNDLDLIEEVLKFTTINYKTNADLHFALIKKVPMSVYRVLVEKTNRDFNGEIDKCDNETLLNIAAYWGNLDILKLIIEKSSTIKTTKTGANPLHSAAINGHLDIIEYLMQKFGQALNIPDIIGDTPLHMAADVGQAEACRVLLKYSNRELTLKNFLRLTPLECSVLKGCLQVFELLTNYTDGEINKTWDFGQTTSLHLAAHGGYTHLCKFILDRMNGNKNPQDQNGLTPIHNAVMQGHWETCQLLLSYINVADSVPTDKNGRTPMHIAAEKGCLKTFLVVLEHFKNDVNPQDNFGATPFLRAAANGNLEICKLIIKEKGKNINSGDQRAWNFTPLHYAAQFGYFEICKLIIESSKGLDFNFKDEDGMTPLHMAAQNGFLDICSLIVENTQNAFPECYSLWTPLHLAAFNGFQEIVEFFINISSPQDLLRQTRFGTTPLHEALRSGLIEGTLFLIEKSPVEIFYIQDDDGNTRETK